jgi:hypothetical protein
MSESLLNRCDRPNNAADNDTDNDTDDKTVEKLCKVVMFFCIAGAFTALLLSEGQGPHHVHEPLGLGSRPEKAGKFSICDIIIIVFVTIIWLIWTIITVLTIFY